MTITLDSVALPDDMRWVDEFDYSSVAQSQSRTLTGGLIIQESEKIKGRSITLTGSEDSSWMTRATVIELQTLMNTVDNDMVLTFHGESFTVRFNRSNSGSPVVAKPIFDCSDHDDDANYYATISLITV